MEHAHIHIHRHRHITCCAPRPVSICGDNTCVWRGSCHLTRLKGVMGKGREKEGGKERSITDVHIIYECAKN